ncbi:MAG: YdiU family protein [Burkholderiaceae bacterium]|nr:YdiU family protein [Roseateles sp.]MBV8470630.1 YdiU family protein [Burkholderiaceae bacterium]
MDFDPDSAALASPPAAAPAAPSAPWLHALTQEHPRAYPQLGERFVAVLPPEPMREPHWVAHSPACADWLGLPVDWMDADSLQVLSGNALVPGMRTWASVYSGHQFGVWAGQLGDGRALHLGEWPGPGGPIELQLKGAGRTPFSRMGDGRAVLRSSIREFLCSEAMAALGIPSTRALCVTASSHPVQRETLETAAIVTRAAPSFLRFGHFEHFAHTDQHQALQALASHFIRHFAPECAEAPQPVLALLSRVSRQTATLMAQWQAVGFCHGVMNTDNMSMLGLTLDYGPFGFLDGFDPGHICNHSDQQGRYAYARQPQMAFWNLHALAQALLPLLAGEEEAERTAAAEQLRDALDVYRDTFASSMLEALRAKLGLASRQDEDQSLIDDWLRLLAAERVDYTIIHRRLCHFDSRQAPEAPVNAPLRDLFLDREGFDAWTLRYQARLAQEGSRDVERSTRMRRVNPAVVLRNHLAEGAIQQAQAGDFSEVQRLLKVLSRPFDEPEQAGDAGFPPDWAQHLQVSCSS